MSIFSENLGTDNHRSEISDFTPCPDAQSNIPHTLLLLPSCPNHCLATLDLRAGVEQTLDCLIVQNRQAMQSVKRSIGQGNMVDGLYFCATLTGHSAYQIG